MTKSKFQTIVEIPEFQWKTGYSKKNLFIGSCFTENIGNKMDRLKYNLDINPFGILYNPFSIANSIQFLLEDKYFYDDDLIYHNGLWQSFFHHSRFSDTDKNRTLENINGRIRTSSDYLKNADFIFLSLGTAWVYEYKKSGRIVSNCHKIPTSEFSRRRLGVEEITNVYMNLLPRIWKFNPDCKIIFTVSPVRHWKDGAIENQRSKSTLLLAVDKIINDFGREKCAYFPSYEIMMDELRDYRFYADDMIHISETGINHIWNLFEEHLIDDASRKIAPKINKITKALEHKPFSRISNEYLSFLKTTLKQIKVLQKDFPSLNFEVEKKHFMNEIDEIKNKLEQFRN